MQGLMPGPCLTTPPAWLLNREGAGKTASDWGCSAPASISSPIQLPFLPTTNILSIPRVPGNHHWELRSQSPSLCQPPGNSEVSCGLAWSLQPLWGLGLSPSRAPSITLCPTPDKGSTIDPDSAGSCQCQEMQFTTSSEVTAEEARRPLALLCRY